MPILLLFFSILTVHADLVDPDHDVTLSEREDISGSVGDTTMSLDVDDSESASEAVVPNKSPPQTDLRRVDDTPSQTESPADHSAKLGSEKVF